MLLAWFRYWCCLEAIVLCQLSIRPLSASCKAKSTSHIEHLQRVHWALLGIKSVSIKWPFLSAGTWTSSEACRTQLWTSWSDSSRTSRSTSFSSAQSRGRLSASSEPQSGTWESGTKLMGLWGSPAYVHCRNSKRVHYLLKEQSLGWLLRIRSTW